MQLYMIFIAIIDRLSDETPYFTLLTLSFSCSCPLKYCILFALVNWIAFYSFRMSEGFVLIPLGFRVPIYFSSILGYIGRNLMVTLKCKD